MRVLIADDEPVSRLVIATAVRKLGHHVRSADDGERAWKLFVGEEWDAVICDRSMPGIHGDELCRRIREHKTAAYPYFIFLTSLSEKRSVLEGMAVGADDYLLKPLDPEELAIRLAVAERISKLHAELHWQRQELQKLNERLFDQSRTDSLTGAGSRRKLDEDLERFAERAQRYGERFCAIIFDVDEFKKYNDGYGHPAGDGVLRRIAGQMRSLARAGDEFYRYGGEEFVVILPCVDLDCGVRSAERFRAAIEELGITHAFTDRGRVTVSLGVAMLDPKKVDVAAWLDGADAALYVAKRNGRNRVAALPDAAAQPAAPRPLAVAAP